MPIEVPEGVSRQGVFGDEMDAKQVQNLPVNGRGYSSFAMLSPTANVVTKSGTNSSKAESRRVQGAGGGGRGGSGSGVSAGSVPSPRPAGAAQAVVIVSDAAEISTVASPEEQQRTRLQSRFHPSILAVIDRLKKKDAKPATDEAKFIRDGKAEIQIWLTDKSDETLAKLKELGFEVVLDPKTAKLVIGRLPIDKLAALAELKFVRYVAPQVPRD